jgi:hypothetical protein
MFGCLRCFAEQSSNPQLYELSRAVPAPWQEFLQLSVVDHADGQDKSLDKPILSAKNFESSIRYRPGFGHLEMHRAGLTHHGGEDECDEA